MGYECDCGKECGRLSDYTKHIAKCQARIKRSRRIDELAESLRKAGDIEMKRRKLRRLEGPTGTNEQRKLNDRSKHVESETNTNVTISSSQLNVFQGEDDGLGDNESTEVPAMSQHDLANQNGESSRPKRNRRPTQKVIDMLPEGPAPLPPHSPSPEPQPEPQEYRRIFIQLTERVKLRLTDTVRTTVNSFGLSRLYYGRPTRIPDENLNIEELSGTVVRDSAGSDKPDGPFANLQSVEDAIYPYPNLSAWRIGDWFWRQGETKSKAGLKSLVNDVLLADDFNKEELRNVAWDTIDDKLAKGQHADKLSLAEGWKQSSVEILVPTGIKTSREMKKKMKSSTSAAAYTVSENPVAGRKFIVEGVFYRPLVPLVRDILENNPAILRFHFEPFRHIWKPNVCPAEERIFDEVYSSDAFLEMHNELQNSPTEYGCKYPRAILALMFMSDATHLAQFGDASLWPVYIQFGNQRKYERCRPSMHAIHHVAYLKKLPPDIIEFIRSIRGGKAATNATLTHCRRELFHAMIKLLLDPAFVYAWKHGIVINCYDGITRRVYFRIFTWSADYPEKVLLAAMRDGGQCLCPTCLICKSKIPLLGSRSDMSLRLKQPRQATSKVIFNVNAARKTIYEDGYVVNSAAVNSLLKKHSYVPTENAFQVALGDTGFNYFKIFVVDLLHEFELGVWKMFFIHLLRILYTQGTVTVQELDERFRLVPAFGRGTIRRFQGNVSDLKKLAARNYEDILQCVIAVFDGLISEPHNTYILRVIWDLLMWHALAKLRMHTESTLALFQRVTQDVGKSLRFFTNEVCNAFDTKETPSERQARQRREKEKSQMASVEPNTVGGVSGFSEKASGIQKPDVSVSKERSKKFNMQTYKVHALGDYPRTIRWMGTTDSYSTQISELEHKRAKNRYRHRTNKRDFVGQLAKTDSRIRRMQRAAETLRKNGIKVPEHQVSLTESLESTGPISPEAHYHISHDTRHPLYYGSWIGRHSEDPALNMFLERMKNHVLSRLHGNSRAGEETDFSIEERNKLFFQHERIYRHSVLRINFTTYDVGREQDIVNPQTSKCFIMLYSNEDEKDSSQPKHPFWYAEVLGIFHANVRQDTPDGFTPYKLIDFLWVRWLGLDPKFQGKSKVGELDCVGYISSDDPEAFGFLDPDCVIRAVHLIPVFKHGRTINLCPPSVARDPEGDWEYFYVNRFVDRDMFMRYLGGGVGHLVPPGHDSLPVSSMFDSIEEDEPELMVSSDSATDSGNEVSSDNTDASESITFSELGGNQTEDESPWDEEAGKSDLDEQDVF